METEQFQETNGPIQVTVEVSKAQYEATLRWREKNPEKYREICAKGSRTYYERNKAKIMERRRERAGLANEEVRPRGRPRKYNFVSSPSEVKAD